MNKDNLLDITEKIKQKLLDEEVKELVGNTFNIDPVYLWEILEDYLKQRGKNE